MHHGPESGSVNRAADAGTLSRRRAVLAATGVVVLVVLWLAHGAVLGWVAKSMLPWLAERSGWELRVGEAQVRLFAPLVLEDVRLRSPEGTDLILDRVVLHADGAEQPGSAVRRWIGSLEADGVSGVIVLAAGGGGVEPGKVRAPSAPVSRLVWLPRAVSVRAGELSVRAGAWAADIKELDLQLSEERAGGVRLGSVAVRRGGRARSFQDLRAVTAWREGTAYLADLSLGDEVKLDAVSLSLATLPALTVEARAFGGYAYADLTATGGRGVKAALTAVNIALAEAGAFAGVTGEMEGRVALAKLTFNGEPAEWLSAQMSLRVEAGGFSWRGNAVEDFRLGASLAGRRLRVNEFFLRQEANSVQFRGTASVPDDAAAWRQVPVELDINAQVGKVQALAGLFGAPWSGLTGGLQVEGALAGKAGDGDGWLRVRGWDLRVPGVRPASVQADVVMQGRDLQVTGLDAQSGPNFLRGTGRISLEQPTAYQGRLELRVSEVAAYLDRLGRFAPDWAREGGVLLFWDGDGTADMHSGVVSLELVKFTGDLNPVPVNAKLSATYSPGNIYVSRVLLDRGPLSLSSSFYFGDKGLSVQDLQLFSGRTRLLFGEMFLPLSLAALLDRKPWPEVTLAGGDIYANVRSDDLDLASLVALFGQQTSLRGRVDLRLDARGTWADPAADGLLSVEGLRAGFPSFALPEGKLETTLQVKEHKAALQARLTPKGSKSLSLDTLLPLASGHGEGGWGVFDRAAPLEVRVEVPRTRVDLFGLKPGGFLLADGTLEASLRASGTMAAPALDGSASWEGISWQLAGGWTPWQGMKGRLTLAGTKAEFVDAQAEVGGRALQWSGGVELQDPASPAWDVTVRAKSLPLFGNETVRLQTTAELRALGNRAGGKVDGSIDLAGSAVLKGVAVDPGLQTATAGHFQPVARAASGPFAGWQTDIKITSSTPVPVGAAGNLGWLEPDLYLQGEPGSPLLLGSLHVKDLQIGLPSASVMTVGGDVHFTREFSWRPWIDLRGITRLGGHEVRAGFVGPLDERKLELAAEPALTLPQAVILLDTGVAPATATVEQVAALHTEAQASRASWPGLDKLRGLLGWDDEASTTTEGKAAELGGEGGVASYDWTLR